MIEFITFTVTMLLLFFLFMRKAREERYRKEHPEEFAEEQTEQKEVLRELLESLEIGLEGEKPPPPPPPEEAEKPMPSPPIRPVIKPAPLPALDKHKLRAKFEEPFVDPYKKLEIKIGRLEEIQKDAFKIGEEEHSRILTSFKGLKSPKEMIILREILEPPIALR